MKWFWRAVVGVPLLAVVLVVVGVVWVNFFFDPEVYRERLIAWATDRTNSTFNLDGELEVKFDMAGGSTAVTVFLGDLAIENRPGFAAEKIFRARGVSLEIPVWQLLNGQVYPSITVLRPQLHLIRTHPTRTNWQSLAAAVGRHEEPIHEWDLIQGFAGFAMMGLRVIDGTIHWTREDTGEEITISSIDFEMASLVGGQPVRAQTQLTLEHTALAKPLEINAAVTVGREDRPGVVRAEKMQLEIAGPGVLVTSNALEMESDSENRSFQLRKAGVTGAVGNDEFHLAVETLNYVEYTDRLTATGVTVDWFGTGMEGRAELPSLFVDSLWTDVLSPPGHQLGSIRFGGWQSTLKFISEVVIGYGTINLSIFDWSNSLSPFGVPIPKGRWSPLVPVQGNADVSIGKRGIDIPHFDFNWGESKFSGSLTQLLLGQSGLEFKLIDELIEAEGNLTIAFHTVGLDQTSWLTDNAGSVAFHIREGRIRKLGRIRVFGTEIDQYIRQARVAMGMEAKWSEIESGIPFSNLKTTLFVKDGEVWTDGFVMDSLGLKFFGRGRYILSKDEFDSLWHVKWEKSIRGSSLALLEQLQTVVVPFRVSGRGNFMSVALDIPELLRLLSE